MARPKKVKATEAQVIPQPIPQPAPQIVLTQKVPTTADKRYVRENYNKLAEEQIAKDTGLSLAQISELVTSPDLDNLEDEKNNKPINLRRFAKISNTIQMTAAQSALDDKTLRDSGATMTMEERYGPDFSRIEFKRENIDKGR